MLITTIESQVRRFTGLDSAQYTQSQFLEDLNIVKDDFWSDIVSTLDEDSNYEEWTVNTTTTNSEYSIPEVSRTQAGAKMIKGISMCYNGELYPETGLKKYVKATEVNKDTLEYEWNYYVENQDSGNPIYFIGDNSFFIAPSFRVSELGENRIKLTGIRKIPDYTISTTEFSMRIPVDYHRVLLLGVLPYALMTKRVDDGIIQKAQNDYYSAKLTAIKNLSTRKEGPITMLYPEDNEYSITL